MPIPSTPRQLARAIRTRSTRTTKALKHRRRPDTAAWCDLPAIAKPDGDRHGRSEARPSHRTGSLSWPGRVLMSTTVKSRNHETMLSAPPR
jgi:hypothetical protein